jgi:Flp pilus assembly protein TadD
MGRTRRKPKTKDHPRPPQQPQPSKEALLSNADALVAQCEYDLALECIHRVLEIDALNVRAREIKGIILIESGDLDGAREVRMTFLLFNPNRSRCIN